MHPYRVVINDGSTTTHRVVVEATCQEHAEQLALLVAGVSYEAVKTIVVTPL